MVGNFRKPNGSNLGGFDLGVGYSHDEIFPFCGPKDPDPNRSISGGSTRGREMVKQTVPSNPRGLPRPTASAGLEGTAHMQWFHFQVSNVRGRPITVNVLNAWEASFPTGTLRAMQKDH